MKRFNIFNFFIFGAMIFISIVSINAQTENPNNEPPAPNVKQIQPRPNLLRELGLTREQLQAVRQIYANNKDQVATAQRNHRLAQKTLDEAIYADNLSESEVQKLITELQNAHAEMIKIRASTELEVRKILTPEQLVRFRELRIRFGKMRENFQKRLKNAPPNENSSRPNQFMKRQNKN